MNTALNEEIIYCRHCGGANRKSAVVCEKCEKKLHTNYRPFYDFLKKHTKDELKGTVTDTVFSYLKNFLLSHVYGMALSVTIVATAVSATYAADTHIKRVSEVKNADNLVVTEADEEKTELAPLSEDDLYAFEHLTCNLDAFADGLRSSDSFWDQTIKYYDAPSDMYAINNIEGFEFDGPHEIISNPIDMDYYYIVDGEEEITYSDRYSDPSTAVTGEDCTTDIAKAMHEKGYRVAECDYVLSEAAGNGEYDFKTHSGTAEIVKKLVYKFVFVEHEGEWYIVQDTLVERINKGDNNENSTVRYETV